MPLTLAMSDNKDGTGGVATITGSAGATNVVYFAVWTGVMTSLAWTLGGTVIGDGAVPLPLGVGYFVFQVMTNAALGPLAYKSFTANVPAVHYQYLQGTYARLNQLSMANLTSANLKVAWLPRAEEVDLQGLPLIYIAPPGFEMEMTDGVLNQDDVLYPIVIAIMVSQKSDSVANLPLVLKWREQIRLAIVNQRLPGVETSMWAVPKMMNILDPDSFVRRSILLSVLGFGFRTRQVRGLT